MIIGGKGREDLFTSSTLARLLIGDLKLREAATVLGPVGRQLGREFNRIADYEHFRRGRVAFDTVEWDCGVDLAPEFVYAKCDVTKEPFDRDR
jgi:hypothetical protein